MLNKKDIVSKLIPQDFSSPVADSGNCFAATNIALVKYWGKRDVNLNLPVTASLSVTLPGKGTHTRVLINNEKEHRVYLNDERMQSSSVFFQRVVNFLNLFPTQLYYDIHTNNSIPTAAGLASSASGFSALTLALNCLHGWQLSDASLSILARMGSGSACRSIWPGFVEWQSGTQKDGMDCHGVPIDLTWPELHLGILMVQAEEKPLSSRQAMQQCQQTSPFYTLWPKQVEQDLITVKQAITLRNFTLLGEAVERNAIAMHALMQTSWPPIQYALPESLRIIKAVWSMRAKGIPIYFTQDAGPNIKLLFLQKNIEQIVDGFSGLSVVPLFSSSER